MDIKKRINARKIVLSYFYQHCFFSDLEKKPLIDAKEKESIPPENEEKIKASQESESDFLDQDFLKAVAEKKQMQDQRDEFVHARIHQYATEYAIEEDFPYILNHFFDQWSGDDVDVDYILKIGSALSRYEEELIKRVDQCATSFSYQQMDLIDQALLLLGYIEFKVIETPKEVVLNEMIELAKRYADDWSPKMINGILHTIFSS